jgi:hypothetical protein
MLMQRTFKTGQDVLTGGRGLGGCVWGSFEGHFPPIKFLTSGTARRQGLHPTVAPAQKSGVMAPWIRSIPIARRRTGHRARWRAGLGGLGGGSVVRRLAGGRLQRRQSHFQVAHFFTLIQEVQDTKPFFV